MSSEKKEVEFRKGLTPTTLILMVILGIAMFYVNARMWWHVGVTLEPFFGGRIGAPIYLPFGFIWFLALIFSLMGKKAAPEIVVLIGSLYIVMDFGFISQWYEPLVLSYYASQRADIQQLLQIVPDIWAPKNPALVEKIFTGGGSIPGEIWGAIVVQEIFFFAYVLANIFTGLFIKEQFIEVERLTFPAVLPATEVLKYHEEGTLLNFGKQKVFYLGWIIGFIVAFFSTINYFIPWFPVFFAWGQYYLTWWDKFLKGINPSIGEWWMFVPVDMIMFYLAPIDVSLSTTIWTGFKALIWPFLAIALGYIQPGQNANAGPVKPLHFSLYHATIAIGFWALIFKADVWIKGLKKFLGMEKEEVKPGRLSWKIIWLGLIGSYLLWFLLFVGLGAGAYAGYLIIFFILYFIIGVGSARVWAETGQWPSSVPPYEAVWLTVTIAHSAGVPNPVASQSFWAVKAAMRPTYHLGQATWTPWATVSTYKMANDLKVNEKDLLIGQIIAVALAAFIGIPLGLSMLYGQGANTFYTRCWYVKALALRATSARDIRGVIKPDSLMDPTHQAHLAAAFIIIGILWFLRSKYAWFFFTPVALFFYSGMWFLSAFPAFILKFLTLKFLGTQTYEKYAVPLALGFVVGMSFGAFLFGSAATFIK